MIFEKEINNALQHNNQERLNIVFEKIYEQYFKLGLFISYQYLNEFDALEVVEDVFFNFYTKIIESRSFNIKNIKQYLCTSVKNESLKIKKSQSKNTPYNDDIEYKNTQKENVISEDEILIGLNELEQYIITEHALLDKTFKEISIEINQPLNTVKSTYRRACLKVKKRIKNK